MESIVITKEIIERASDYIPLLQKTEMAESIAQECIARVKMSKLDKNGNVQPLPDRYQERQILTNLYLMGVLAHEYLHIHYDGDDAQNEKNPCYHLMMPLNTYDVFAGSHIINQLEKFKAEKECKDKVYNLLYDYRKFQRMVYDEITFATDHQNDIVWRFLEAMEQSMKEVALNTLEGNSEVSEASEGHSESKTTEEQIAEAKNKLKQFKEVKEKADKMAAMIEGKLEMLESKAGEK